MAKPNKPTAPAAPVTPAAGETDAASLVNPAPAKSAVEVATEITKAAAPAPAKANPLFVVGGLQYGGDLDEEKSTITIPAKSFAFGVPKAGDACSVNPGDGFFLPGKVASVEKQKADLVIEFDLT